MPADDAAVKPRAPRRQRDKTAEREIASGAHARLHGASKRRRGHDHGGHRHQHQREPPSNAGGRGRKFPIHPLPPQAYSCADLDTRPALETSTLRVPQAYILPLRRLTPPTNHIKNSQLSVSRIGRRAFLR